MLIRPAEVECDSGPCEPASAAGRARVVGGVQPVPGSLSAAIPFTAAASPADRHQANGSSCRSGTLACQLEKRLGAPFETACSGVVDLF